MAHGKEFRVLVASDGSLAATAATVTAASFPWPVRTRAYGVVARAVGDSGSATFVDALEQVARSTAETTTRALIRRWPDVRVRVVDGPAAAAIVRAARHARVDAIVVGWRGHGVVRRLLAGSVSHAVVRVAPCSVLVVRRAVRNVRRVVIGIDGSDQSARAVAFATRLEPQPGARMLLVTGAPLMPDPSNPLLPSTIRKAAASGVAEINRRRKAESRANLERLAEAPRAAGWRVDISVTNAAPLRSLLTAVAQANADLLVVGATGASQVRRLLLGSVAQAVLDRSPVPVLLVR